MSSQLQIHLRVTEKKQTYYTSYGTSRNVVQSKGWWFGPFFFGWEKKRNAHKTLVEKIIEKRPVKIRRNTRKIMSDMTKN